MRTIFGVAAVTPDNRASSRPRKQVGSPPGTETLGMPRLGPCCLAGLLTLAIMSTAAGAQNAPTPAPQASAGAVPGTPLSAEEAMAEMKNALRNLLVAQEGYLREHGTYTTDVAALKLHSREKGAVRVQVRAAGGSGWNGRVTHPALPGKSCVAFRGDYRDVPTPLATDAEKLQPADAGRLVCDTP